MIGPLAKGEVDVMQGSVAAGIFNALERGLDIKIVTALTTLPVGNKYAVWLIRKDLVGQIKDYPDLKGRRIAITGKGALGELAMGKALEKGKLAPGAAEAVIMGFPDMVAGLTNKSVDIAYGVEPWITQSMDKGIAEPWKDIADTLPDYQIGIFLSSPQFVTEKRDIAERWMVAYLKGIREYTDVFFKKKGDKAGMYAALSKYTGVTDTSLYDRMAPAPVVTDGLVSAANMAAQMDWYVGAGYVKTKLPLEKVVYNGLAEYAVQKLGKYQ